MKMTRESTGQSALFVTVFKDAFARAQRIDERRLYMDAGLDRLPEQMAQQMLSVFMQTIRVPEWTRSFEQTDHEAIPATWWDHLKQTAQKRWPKLKLKVNTTKIQTKVSVQFQTYRVCPHHSAIATDRHCERFFFRQWGEIAPVFDTMSVTPVYDLISEKQMNYDEPYVIEVAPDVMKLALAMLTEAQRGQSVMDFYRNASERDIKAYEYPVLVALWELVNQCKWDQGETPDNYIKDWTLFGLPVKINEHLPRGSWRVL